MSIVCKEALKSQKIKLENRSRGGLSRGGLLPKLPLIGLKFLVFVVLAGVALGMRAEAAMYYVGTSGNDSYVGTYDQPYATISKGLSVMSGGDTLIVKDGTYTNRSGMLINDHGSATVPSGISPSFTTIRAENPFGVRIKFTSGLDYHDSIVWLERANRIHIDGFIFEYTGGEDPEYIVVVGTTYNKITRCIVKRSQVNQYGGWFYSDGNYNLFEDCAGVGGARYGFNVGGPDSSTKYNIFRRCVGRMDFNATSQPKAEFSIYGNNSTTGVSNHWYQNCLVIDGHRTKTGDEEKYGGIYNPKTSTNIHFGGNIILNTGVGHAGIFVTDWGIGHTLQNNVVWNLASDSSSWAVGYRPGGSATASYFTIGGSMPGGCYYGGASASNSLCNPAGLSDFLHSSNGNGATILKRLGKSGTFYGETGYNLLQDGTNGQADENLWPWPHEDEIKSVFSEQINTPSGYTPANNVSARGFCTGTSKDGSPQTLTKYIWEYLGNQIPADIYGGSGDAVAPGSPSGLSVR